MTPKGKLLIIGGAEARDDEEDDYKIKVNTNKLARYELLSELLISSRNKKIEIITTGSRLPNEVRKRYQRAFHSIGYPNPGFIHIEDRLEARHPKYLTKVKEAGAVFFSGGDQFRLATILGGTEIIELIKKRYYEDKNFLVAGTSAGAMVMSATMIVEGGTREAMLRSDLKTASGLSLLKNCIIDTHFIKRGRFGRLAHAVVINPEQLGIGLGEDTALIIKNGSEAECRGSGMVVIIDGTAIEQTNVTNVQEDDPVFVENLIVHCLVKCCRFSIKKRQLLNPAISRRKTRLLENNDEE